MIALSSFRPKDKCSPEIWRNQTAAYASWQDCFDEVVFLNAYEPEMDLGMVDTTFFPHHEKPRIRTMAQLASKMQNWVVIINADIILDFRFVEVTDRMLIGTGMKAAVSGRFNFQPGQPLETAQQTDNGLDLFAAHPATWAKVAQFVPEECKLGCCAWDTIVLGMFNHHFRGQVGDLTPARLVFHPIHGERGDQSTPEAALGSPYMSMAKVPDIKIT